MIVAARVLEAEKAEELPHDLRRDIPPNAPDMPGFEAWNEVQTRPKEPALAGTDKLGQQPGKDFATGNRVGHDHRFACQPSRVVQGQHWIAQMAQDAAHGGDVHRADLFGDLINRSIDHSGPRAKPLMAEPITIVDFAD